MTTPAPQSGNTTAATHPGESVPAEGQNSGGGNSSDGAAKTLLVVHHSPTEVGQRIAAVVLDAAREAQREIAESGAASVRIVERDALIPDANELRAADAVILGTPANFGYISGALKHYFDSTFDQVKDDTKGLPVSWWIRGGYDTTGAEKALRAITTGLQWDVAVEPVMFTGDVEPQREVLHNMAQAMVGLLVE
ncbi:flavodoxin family protein [Corynebacterium heidelbergense]|uniref:Flavodoxin n=1 Tax=Corynebacterium heidelbergense TaxID=2055947 RepID=A0A364V5G8_9CORY|nr:NAD(P)H-dependent oxidoreductase [Corynebacterium heidelbergense]RAV31883.1 flavodoxin [Corynebacterium heidelbergense]